MTTLGDALPGAVESLAADPPRRITQPLYNLERRDLDRMIADADLDAIEPWCGVLQNFAEDLLAGADVQPELMRWMLPYLLRGWQRSISTARCGSFVSIFHHALIERPALVRETLGADAQQAAERVVIETVCHHTADSAGAAEIRLDWTRHLVTVTAAWPDVFPAVWDRWITLTREHTSSAWSMLGYLSHLAWSPEDNPLDGPGFSRWRPWQHALMEEADARWSTTARAALTARLSRASRSTLLGALADRLAGADAFAELICDDLAARADAIDARVEALASLLAEPATEKWWPDELGQAG